MITPLGPVEVSLEEIDKPGVGLSLIGLLRPVLEAPTWIRSDGADLTFCRAVLGPDGSVRGYARVCLAGDCVRIWVSDDPEPLEQSGPPDLIADATGEDEASFKSLRIVNRIDGVDRFGVVIITPYAVAATLMGWEAEFFKSDAGSIPPGARWITVHPNGEGSKGTPVLVEPVKGGSGHMRVIGGAGGKLNMLKLRAVKSPEDYKAQHGERAAAKRARLKDQTRRDRSSASMMPRFRPARI